MANKITYLGHAGALIELDGLKFLTDPIIRKRVGFLWHYKYPKEFIQSMLQDPPDFVLLSHLHPDHCDLKSLKKLDVPIITHPRSAAFLQKHGLTVKACDKLLDLGNVKVLPTLANHPTATLGKRATSPQGYILTGSKKIYFAGDTDLFDHMIDIGPVDLALIPLGGWARKLGPGHLNPVRAAYAVQMIQAKEVIPIHWDNLQMMGMAKLSQRRVCQMEQDFKDTLKSLGLDNKVNRLAPGQLYGF